MMHRNSIVMNEAGADTGTASNGGGAGAGILSTGGGTAVVKEASTSAGVERSTGATTQPAWSLPENWRDTLPEDLKNEPSLKTFNNFEGMVKSLVHAQKAIGADKVVIPNAKHATPEDWKSFYQKIGQPSDIKEYNLELPKDVQFKPEFIDAVKEQAFKDGILPKQMQGMLSKYAELTKSTMAQEDAQRKQVQTEGINKLKTEWGEAFDKKCNEASFAAKKFVDPDTMKFLEQTGLANHPGLVKAFAKMAESLGEDTMHTGESTASGVMSPQEAAAEVSRKMADPIYWDKNHPAHLALVQEVAELNKMRFPEPKGT